MSEVEACPECDSAKIFTGNSRDPRGPDAETTRFRCDDCGARFDEAVRRESRGNPNAGLSKLGSALAKANPEDLGLSPEGERRENLRPDGGVVEEGPETHLRTTISSPDNYWYEVREDDTDGESAFYRLVAVDAHRDDMRVAKKLLAEWLNDEESVGEGWSTVYDGVREDSDEEGWTYSLMGLSRGAVRDDSIPSQSPGGDAA